LIKNSKIENNNPGVQYSIEVVIDQSVGSMINTICNSMSFAGSTIEFHNCIINGENYP
jgi:hypothetical protein